MKSIVWLLILLPVVACSQNSFQQDSSLNNLVHEKDYVTCSPCGLGAVKKYGGGKTAMLLIAGIGFGGDVFKSFRSMFGHQYTIYTITPAGFEGTPAPPMPDTVIPYAALTWTQGIVNGLLQLIEKEKLIKPIVIAHHVTATQAAMELALNHADKIGKVIFIAGSPYRYFPGQKNGQWSDWPNEKTVTPEQRAKLCEVFWAPKWFKTVTKKTWDDNMWKPEDYCSNSKKGQSLFKASAQVPLPVMIRYMIEWMAYDRSDEFKNITVPTLVLLPDFKELLTVGDTTNIESCKTAEAKQYLKYMNIAVWNKARNAGNKLIRVQTIEKSNIFIWYDQPTATFKAITDFLKSQD